MGPETSADDAKTRGCRTNSVYKHPRVNRWYYRDFLATFRTFIPELALVQGYERNGGVVPNDVPA